MLTPPDEYFNHQVAMPHSVVGSSDPSWRERYWISFQDTVGKETVVTCGLGKYPNQDVYEGFVVVSRKGLQRNLRLSRTMGEAGDQMRVGPYSIEVVEPLRAVRLMLDDPESGMAMDVTWTATMAPMLEERHFEITRRRITHDLVRYVQLGRAAGTMTVDGERIELAPEEWWGERDHSWGMRPLPPAPGGPPGIRPHWRFLMFCPLQFADFAVHLYLYEQAPGRPLHLTAELSRPFGEPPFDDVVTGVEHDLCWDADAPAATLTGGTIRLRLGGGEDLTIDLTAHPGRAHLSGGGYQIDHGRWKGELVREHEEVDLSDVGVLRRYAAGASDHLVEARCNGQTGYGVMEYMVRRGYAKYEAAQRRPV